MKDKLIGLLGPVVSGLGYELVEVEWTRRAPTRCCAFISTAPMALRSGSTIASACSRSVGAVLEAADLIGHEYRLEVSSRGFDRPLRTAEHFERFAGSEARIELAAPVEGRRRFRGRLGPFEGGMVSIEVDRKEWKLPLSGISKARLVG
jgi:ribosome maturation factor RimP